MFNFFFGFLALVSLLSTFSLTYSFGGIHRTFLSLSGGVMESAVYPLVDQEGQFTLFYDTPKLETAVKDYLARELADYTETYHLGFYYFFVTSGTPCRQNCDGVQIRLIVDINPLVIYDDALRFELHTRGS